MKKILITLFAINALSGMAYANGDADLRDSDTYFGKYSTKWKNQFNGSTSTEVAPLAIGENETGLSSFERMMRISRNRDQGNRQ